MYETMKIVMLSLCLIMFLHYIYNYLLKVYTKPVIKDIIGIQTQKYKNIINTMNKEKELDSYVTEPTYPKSLEMTIESDLLQHALNEM